MPPDQDSLLISLKPDASRCDSNSIEPATRQVETENDTGTDRPDNLELGRGTSAVYLGPRAAITLHAGTAVRLADLIGRRGRIVERYAICEPMIAPRFT